jgi:predicted trehalose synthase
MPGAEAALIARVDGRYVYDAPHDPDFARELLRRILNGAVSTGPFALRGVTLPTTTRRSRAAVDLAASRVLTGEQSNTSIVIGSEQHAGGSALICKLFRTVHPGENLDVAVQSALARAGCAFVPKPIGYLRGTWPGPDPLTADLAFVQEFLPAAPDAWSVALNAARAGDRFDERARALGETTAAVHADLARALPTREASEASIAAIVDGMRERYRTARAEVPALAPHAAEIEAVFAAAQAASWPRLQHIHGDYHLGQVLDVPGRGWMLIDFEGEPQRPAHERGLPDAPLRDVAGMLRSLAYVAGTLAMAGQGTADVTAWAAAARAAFLAGYAARSGQDGTHQRALLDAFELDKAVYESLYEVRNRPDWLPIPLAGVSSLLRAA